jgi:adenylyltransferase/sulfurtransferase
MKDYLLRYQRHVILEGFGIEAQEKLSKAKVLLIGVGGLGCPILQYLAAAGVGQITIADHDVVSLPNLNRQILFGTEDIGKYKVDVAAKKINALNELTTITTIKERWNQALSLQYFPDYDLIIDATDNFESRYLINDGCVLLNKPLVFGAVSKFEGQVSLFNVMKNGMAVNYRDLFPVPPKNSEVQSCAEGGVLGVLPGIIGVMQATETIKFITGVGETLANRLLTYNALSQHFNTIELIKHPESATNIPTSEEAYLQTNYEWLCQ